MAVIKTSKDILKEIYKPRDPNSRKYDFGLVLVIGGSQFYSGSPALSALAAFRSGADMVRVIAPKRAADIIASFTPALAAYPLEGDWLSKNHLATLIAMTESAKDVSNGKTAVVIGGGAGRSKETQEVIAEYLSKVQVPVIVDADAIYAIASKPEVFKGKNFLFTPHSYEFFCLTGREVAGKSDEERVAAVQEAALALGATILLKGKTDIISNGKDVALNSTGNAYMTIGGTGDVLAGICGSLASRGLDLFTVAQAAAFLNGKAGESVSQKKKDGLIVTDLIEALPEASF